MYRKLKGKILYRGYSILSGYRLSGILKVAQHLKMPGEPVPRPPEGNFKPSQPVQDIMPPLENLMSLCAGGSKKKILGFLTLENDMHGTYWFTCVRGFHSAVERSIDSLEFLSDEIDIQNNRDVLSRVNNLYRYLTSLLEE